MTKRVPTEPIEVVFLRPKVIELSSLLQLISTMLAITRKRQCNNDLTFTHLDRQRAVNSVLA